MADPDLILVPLETLRVGQREVVVVDVPEGASPRSWVGRVACLGGRLVRITGVGTFALPDGATFRRCDLVVEDAPDDLGEQVSVRQFSCIHGVEPDGWCTQCDPEESARYLDHLDVRCTCSSTNPGIANRLHALDCPMYRAALDAEAGA